MAKSMDLRGSERWSMGKCMDQRSSEGWSMGMDLRSSEGWFMGNCMDLRGSEGWFMGKCVDLRGSEGWFMAASVCLDHWSSCSRWYSRSSSPRPCPSLQNDWNPVRSPSKDSAVDIVSDTWRCHF